MMFLFVHNVSTSSVSPTENALSLDVFETDDDYNDIWCHDTTSVLNCGNYYDEPYADASYNKTADNEHNSEDYWDQNYEHGTLCLLKPTMPTDDKHTS